MGTNQTARVLVVDGYETTQRMIRNMLKQLGFTSVVGASNVTAALEQLREYEFDLVLSDWHMEPNGYWLLKEMRTDERLCNLPLIMVLAHENAETIEHIREAGGAILIKPFGRDSLRTKIDSVLGSR